MRFLLKPTTGKQKAFPSGRGSGAAAAGRCYRARGYISGPTGVLGARGGRVIPGGAHGTARCHGTPSIAAPGPSLPGHRREGSAEAPAAALEALLSHAATERWSRSWAPAGNKSSLTAPGCQAPARRCRCVRSSSPQHSANLYYISTDKTATWHRAADVCNFCQDAEQGPGTWVETGARRSSGVAALCWS